MAVNVTVLFTDLATATPTFATIHCQIQESTTGQILGRIADIRVNLSGAQQTAIANIIANAVAKMQTRVNNAISARASNPTLVPDLNEPAPGETP